MSPVNPEKDSHSSCLSVFRRIFSRDHGPRSSFIRRARLPSASRSIHRYASVHTVCGQANPHQSRPANAVKKNSDSAAMTSSQVRRKRSCGKKVKPNR